MAIKRVSTGSPHLTPGHSDKIKVHLSQSYEGMAHFAGTGPAGATCADCTEYWHTDGREHQGLPVKIRTGQNPCQKFMRMTGSKGGKTIPRKTPACRFFERYTSDDG